MIRENLRKLEGGESINETEKMVFLHIRDVCNEFTPPVIARVAGGWVRDQLIGIKSDDVDICLEGTGPMQFAEKLKLKFPESGSIAFIEEKPEQRKFVAVARIRLIKGFEIDICGLRPDPSLTDKVPAAIDALRRDFTINSLFFNITTFKVEDYTGGISDLENKLIRTPLSIGDNFSDDPCRILRAFRFATRFTFDIDPAIFNMPHDIIEMFKSDISRERIEIEITKMLKGPNPVQCLIWIKQIGLFGAVFDSANMWNLDPELTMNRCETAISRINTPETILAAIYFDLDGMVCDPMLPKKKIHSIECAVTRQLIMPLNFADRVRKIVLGAHTLPLVGRVPVGQWLRTIGPLWTSVRAVLFDDKDLAFFDGELVPFVATQNLDNVWSMKPLINGTEIAALHNVKPGPQIKKLLDQLIDWQLENPDGTAEQYRELVSTKK